MDLTVVTWDGLDFNFTPLLSLLKSNPVSPGIRSNADLPRA
jgi:hypothetical protein